MSVSLVRNVDFGQTQANITGSSGVGYTLLDVTGSVYQSRTTSGVYQLVSGSGIYAAYVTFPDDWKGQILWDTGTVITGTCGTQYAVEDYDYLENNPKTDSIYDIEHGRWRIVGDEMIFYKEDNVTEVARFDLYDENGLPTSDAVFERVRK